MRHKVSLADVMEPFRNGPRRATAVLFKMPRSYAGKQETSFRGRGGRSLFIYFNKQTFTFPQ
jgi:hypothetical protein